MLTGHDAPELFFEAVQAYMKYCATHNYVFIKPSIEDSTISRKYVHLRNSNGPLADYVIATKEVREVKP